MASSQPSPGPLRPQFRIPLLPTGSHTPSPGGHPTPFAHMTLATPPRSPGSAAVATDKSAVGAVPLVPAPVPWVAVAAPPPGRDGPFMPQTRPAPTSEAASGPQSFLLPPRLGGLLAGPLNSIRAGDRPTHGGGRRGVGLEEDTSDPFSPRRVAAFAASGSGAAVAEPRQVAGIRPRTARVTEARATLAEKKARRPKPQVWHCKTFQVDCTSAKNMLAHKATSGHERKAAEHAGTPHCVSVTGHLNRLAIFPPTCRVDATLRLPFACI